MKVAAQTGLLLVVGTSGATALPGRIAWDVRRAGGTIIDVNIEPGLFSRLAEDSPGGGRIQGPGASILPEIARIFSAGKNPP